MDIFARSQKFIGSVASVLRGRVLRGRMLRGRVLRGRVLRGRVLRERVFRGRVLRGRVLRGRVFDAEDAYIHVIKTKYMPLLFYGADCLRVDAYARKKLSIIWNTAFH